MIKIRIFFFFFGRRWNRIKIYIYIKFELNYSVAHNFSLNMHRLRFKINMGECSES